MKKLLIIFVVLLPSIIRILNFNLDRIHGDDMLTAYFSAHYNLLKTNFFAPVPSNIVDWVSQFPSPFFAFQKIFFIIFGESLLSVKLSVIPYVLIVSIFTYKMAKQIFNEKIALVAILLYSFFTPSLYLETLGLHFVSSTAMFLMFFYFMVNYLKTKKIHLLIIASIFCDFCYLFYSSSYIAFPFYILFFLYEIIFNKKRLTTIRDFFIGAVVVFVILSPFVFYMFKTNNFYLTKRVHQVNLLSGEWSSAAKTIKNASDATKIVLTNSQLSIKSMYEDGVGGHGGYDFGHLAFFSILNLSIFLTGILTSAFLIIRRKKIELFFIVLIIVASFVFGVVLTIPPPAFHRFSLAFPFITLVMTLPFHFFEKIEKKSKIIAFAFYFSLLFIYATANILSFQKETKDEKYNTEIKLAKFIVKNYPRRNIYVASFPGFSFEKIFYFVEKPLKENIKTDYHINFLNRFNRSEKYVYVIIFPTEFIDKFKEKDPNGKIINFSNDYNLFVN